MGPKPNPWYTLFHSRKFWLVILDLVVSTILYFVPKYAPGAVEDTRFLVAAIQPVFLLIIYSITQQNVAGINATETSALWKMYNSEESEEESTPPAT